MLLENGDFDEKSKCGGISNGYSLDCDVVVVGGGGLGLVAAVRAAEAGVKKIVVIEKTSKPGGNTMLAIGMMGADTQTQKNAGSRFRRILFSRCLWNRRNGHLIRLSCVLLSIIPKC